jgi:DNA invertase Pin-like site-specific DNA recombinase
MYGGTLMMFGEHERELITDRVTDVRRSLVEAGSPYGRVAFGYRLRPATPEEIRKRLARRLASGGDAQVFEPDPTRTRVAPSR